MSVYEIKLPANIIFKKERLVFSARSQGFRLFKKLGALLFVCGSDWWSKKSGIIPKIIRQKS